eukprot:4132847-Pleurochrysis_carterae.AAC.3
MTAGAGSSPAGRTAVDVAFTVNDASRREVPSRSYRNRKCARHQTATTEMTCPVTKTAHSHASKYW